MPGSLEGSVVVVTGASRGIGRASARLFAERGASVVLAARSKDALLETAADCEAAGGRALAVPTDVADDGAVEDLARAAVGRFGRIDVWVNNAVLLAFGRLEDVPAEANRRIIETNLLGYIHGAQAALRRFRERDSGVLVNVSSGFGVVGSPYIGAYAATKFAQRGLGQVLRGELRGTGVRVCTVMPGGVDTPAYRLAGNYTGRPVHPAGRSRPRRRSPAPSCGAPRGRVPRSSWAVRSGHYACRTRSCPPSRSGPRTARSGPGSSGTGRTRRTRATSSIPGPDGRARTAVSTKKPSDGRRRGPGPRRGAWPSGPRCSARGCWPGWRCAGPAVRDYRGVGPASPDPAANEKGARR